MSELGNVSTEVVGGAGSISGKNPKRRSEIPGPFEKLFWVINITIIIKWGPYEQPKSVTKRDLFI